jgi:hypothetical protein
MKIPALRVEVNGELVAIAGAEGLSVLSGQVSFGAGPNRAIDVSHVMFSLMGLAVHGPQPRQFTWGNDVQLKLGDKVTFQITEVDQPSPPNKILRSPSIEELAEAAEVEKRGGSGKDVMSNSSLDTDPTGRSA